MPYLSSFNIRQILSHLSPRTEYIAVAIILFLLTVFFHGSALNGFWRLHDGMHLLFALNHSPWQYFFDPAVIASQSTHLTPWNVLFYDINIALFGLNPQWHYAHLILLIWGAGLLTFVILKKHLGSFCSLLAGVFFLVGLSTTESAQQLMTGHYLTGLIFSQLSLYLYILSVDKNHKSLAILGAVFYLLATACKEVYIPLLIVLPFLPIKSLKERINLFVPYVFAALFYIAWRLSIIQSFIGGYTPTLEGINFMGIFEQLLQIPIILIGSNWYSYVVLLGIGFLLIRAIYRNHIPMLLLLISGLALLSPLTPLTIYPGLDSGNHRFFYFLWWGVSILLAFLLSKAESRKEQGAMIAVGLVFAVVLAVHSSSYKKNYLDNFNAYNEQLYQFVLGQQKGYLLIQGKLGNYWNEVLSSAIKAHKMASNDSELDVKPVDLYELFELKKLNPDADVFQYNIKSHQVENINRLVPAKLQRFSKRFAKDINLNLFIHYDGKTLQWLFGPFTKGRYKIFYTDSNGNNGSLITSHEGKINFSVTESVNFHLSYLAPEGWIAQSPNLSYAPLASPTIEWKGFSVIP